MYLGARCPPGKRCTHTRSLTRRNVKENVIHQTKTPSSIGPVLMLTHPLLVLSAVDVVSMATLIARPSVITCISDLGHPRPCRWFFKDPIPRSALLLIGCPSSGFDKQCSFPCMFQNWITVLYAFELVKKAKWLTPFISSRTFPPHMFSIIVLSIIKGHPAELMLSCLYSDEYSGSFMCDWCE